MNWSDLIAPVTEILVDEAVARAAANGVTLRRSALRPAIIDYVTTTLDRELNETPRAVVRELTLSAIDDDEATRDGLRERIEGSPVFHAANALRIARSLLEATGQPPPPTRKSATAFRRTGMFRPRDWRGY
jgi:hypothetical protein